MYQFFHIQGYARSVNKNTGGNKSKIKHDVPADVRGRNVQEVIDEVLREIPDACLHVDNPQPPTFIKGNRDIVFNIPAEIERRCDEWKKTNRAIQKNTQVLLTGIMSFRKFDPALDIKEEYDANYILFKKETNNFLEKKYGANYIAGVEHLDEENPHIHFYVLGIDSPRIDVLHDGLLSNIKCKGLGLSAKETSKKYREAMKDLQDKFYDEVGIKCGMTRIGPARRRLSHHDAVQERNQAKLVAKHMKQADKAVLEAEKLKTRFEGLVIENSEYRVENKKRTEELKNDAYELKQERKNHEAERVKLKKALDSSKELQALIKKPELLKAIQTLDKNPDLIDGLRLLEANKEALSLLQMTYETPVQVLTTPTHEDWQALSDFSREFEQKSLDDFGL